MTNETGSERAAVVVLLLGTKKGVFFLRADAKRSHWSLEGPHFLGQLAHHVVLDPRDGRTLLVASKTGQYREAPISPALHDHLLRAYDAADTGTVTVAAGVNGKNLNRDFWKRIQAVGFAPWRKAFQSLRASCENDWKAAGVAEATYATWVGHDPKVSREFYVSPTTAEFDLVTGLTEGGSA